MKRYQTKALLVGLLMTGLAISHARAGSIVGSIYGGSDWGQPIYGTSVNALTNSPYFVDPAPQFDPLGWAVSQSSRKMENWNNFDNNYGAKYDGFFQAPQSGYYTFWVCGKGGMQLSLSTDETPAHAVVLAETTINTGAIDSDIYRPERWTQLDGQQSPPVLLQKGQNYYFTFLFQMAPAGGDQWDIGMQLPDGTLDQPMATYYFQPYTNAVVTPTITGAAPPYSMQPLSVSLANYHYTTSITEDDRVLFQIDMAASSQTNAYQWYDNGTLIPGEICSYYVMRATLAENGHDFTCVANGSITSAPIALTVQADGTAPTIISASPNGNPNAITVQFSEPVTTSSATQIANYLLDHSANVTVATMLAADTVKLTTTTLTPGVLYTLTVNNVNDLAVAPNPIAAGTTASFQLTDGACQIKMWKAPISAANGYNVSIAGIFVNMAAVAANPPDYCFWTTLGFETPRFNNANFYVGQIEGYLTPTNTDTYEIGVASDKAAVVFLSTDATPANAVQILSTGDNKQDHRRYYKENTRYFASLTAGQKYYIKMLWTESGGGNLQDGASVGWSGSAFPLQNNSPAIPAMFLSSFKTAGAVTITNNLAAAYTGAEDQSLTLTLGSDGVDGSGPYTYQWLKNSSPIAGANDWRYVTPPLTHADSGATFAVVVGNNFSSITSTIAHITVTADVTAPTLIGAGSARAPQVVATFSKQVDPVSALTLGNYHLKDASGTAISLSNPTLGLDGKTVTLTAAALTPYYVRYTLAVSNVKDRSFAGNVMAPSSSSFYAYDLMVSVEGAYEQPLECHLNPWPPSASFVGDNIVLTGYGVNLGSDFDAGIFCSKWVTGDFDYAAQCLSASVPSWFLDYGIGEFGILAKNSFVKNDALIFAYMQPQYNSYVALYRPGPYADDNEASRVSGQTYPDSAFPGWVRLKRVGNVFSFYNSLDGQSWNLYATEDSGNTGDFYAGPMNSTVALSLVSCSHSISDAAVSTWSYFGPTPPSGLTITRSGPNSASVIWTLGVLQSASNIKGPWSDVLGATNPWPVSGGTAKFYRLRN